MRQAWILCTTRVSGDVGGPFAIGNDCSPKADDAFLATNAAPRSHSRIEIALCDKLQCRKSGVDRFI
jgi:hypothetical protein